MRGRKKRTPPGHRAERAASAEIPPPKGSRLPSGPYGRKLKQRPYLRRGSTVRPFTARTADHSSTTWADSNWHAVEGNGRRLQERLSRATTNKAWKRVKNLQTLLVR